MSIQREELFTKLDKEIKLMSSMVFRQLEILFTRFDSKDNREATYIQMDENEMLIDGLDTQIRKDIIDVILVYTPRAADLRMIMAAYDITVALERTADLIMNIYISLNKVNLEGKTYSKLQVSMTSILYTVDSMVKSAISSFLNQNIELGREILLRDNIVNELYREIKAEIIEISADKVLDKQKVEEIMALGAISHNIERIGDYATNIVEAAIYLIEGKSILHEDIK